MKRFPPFFGLLFLSIVSMSMMSCWALFAFPNGSGGVYQATKQWAWKPVYAADTSYRKVSFIADTPVMNAGKIYVKDNYIYQCEIGAGIHITDNSNPVTAKRIGFLKIPGCEEISIKGNVLYTNNYYDLVAINITNFQTPYLLSRTPNAFYGDASQPHSWEQPKEPGYYQCPNYYTDSVIVKWVRDSVYAYCYK